MDASLRELVTSAVSDSDEKKNSDFSFASGSRSEHLPRPSSGQRVQRNCSLDKGLAQPGASIVRLDVSACAVRPAGCAAARSPNPVSIARGSGSRRTSRLGPARERPRPFCTRYGHARRAQATREPGLPARGRQTGDRRKVARRRSRWSCQPGQPAFPRPPIHTSIPARRPSARAVSASWAPTF
jgi:hypothetical protein